MTKRYCSQFHVSHIFHFVHNGPGFSRKINPGFFKKAKLLEIFIIIFHPQTKPHLNKNRIAGILRSFYKILGSVASSIGAVDPSVIHQLITWTVKPVIYGNHSFLKTCRHGDDFKSRSRLIGIVQTGISPHLVQKILDLLRIHSRSVCTCIQCKRIIQVKFRNIDTGIDLSVSRIHKKNGNSVRLFFLHYL